MRSQAFRSDPISRGCFLASPPNNSPKYMLCLRPPGPGPGPVGNVKSGLHGVIPLRHFQLFPENQRGIFVGKLSAGGCMAVVQSVVVESLRHCPRC